jgi:hypothetical protein
VVLLAQGSRISGLKVIEKIGVSSGVMFLGLHRPRREVSKQTAGKSA